jgi:hypothetical protein
MKRKGCNLKINWNFYHDDEFMREFGQDLSDNFDLPFELVPLDDASMVRLAG